MESRLLIYDLSRWAPPHVSMVNNRFAAPWKMPGQHSPQQPPSGWHPLHQAGATDHRHPSDYPSSNPNNSMSSLLQQLVKENIERNPTEFVKAIDKTSVGITS